MDSTFDREKIIDSMFDPDTAEIIAELENGGKKLSDLMSTLKKSEDEIREKLAYLIEHDFVKEEKIESDTVFTADAEKLAKIVEENQNFSNVDDGLAKMDSYLN